MHRLPVSRDRLLSCSLSRRRKNAAPELHEGFDNDTALTAGLVVNLGFSRQTGFSSPNIPLLIN